MTETISALLMLVSLAVTGCGSSEHSSAASTTTSDTTHESSGSGGVVLHDPPFEIALPPNWVTYDADKQSPSDFVRRLSSVNPEAARDFADRVSKLQNAHVRILSVDGSPVHGFAASVSIAVVPRSLVGSTVSAVRHELMTTPGATRVHVENAILDGHVAVRSNYLLRLKNPDGHAVTMRAVAFFLPTSSGRLILLTVGVPADRSFSVADSIVSSVRIPAPE